MAWKAYRKLVPQNAVRLPGGRSLKFDTVDGTLGFYATQDPNLQRELEQLIRQQQFGLSEIPEADFHAFLEKKNQGVKPLGREEFSPTSLSKLIQQSAQLATDSAVAAVDTTKAPTPNVIAPVISTPQSLPAQAPTTPEFTPNVGRRRAGRRKPSVPPE